MRFSDFFPGESFFPIPSAWSEYFDIAGLLSSGEPFLLASDLPGFVGPDSIRVVLSFDLADLLSLGERSLLTPSVESNPSDSELCSDSDASKANNMRFPKSFPGEPFLPWPVPSTPFVPFVRVG